MQLDAYTVRKMAPRLLIAVIGVNLSIYLCLAAVDLTNIVGKGLGQLLITPFDDAKVFDINVKGNVTNSITGGIIGGSGILAGSGVLAAALAAIFGGTLVSGAGALALGAAGTIIAGLLPFLFLAVVSIGFVALAVLLTVIIRQGLLVFLIIISPIAIALFVLPGTEKYFRQWWSIFLKTLMVYPIIAVIFAMSDILGAIIMDGATKDSVTGIAGLAMIMTGIIVIYAPLFLIPFAFKFAGGVIGAMYDVAQGQTSKASGGLRNKIRQSADNQDSWLGGFKNRSKERRDELGLTGSHIVGGGFTALGALAKGKGVSGAKSAYGSRGRRISAQRALTSRKKFQESQLAELLAGDDDISKAAFHGGTAEQVAQNLMNQSKERFGGVHKDENGNLVNWDTAARIRNREEATNLVMRTQSQYGNSVRKLIAQEEYAKATTAYKGEEGAAEALVMASDTGGSQLLRTRALVNQKQQQKAIGRELGMASTAKILGMQMDYEGGSKTGVTNTDFEMQIIDSAIDKTSPSQLATMDNNGLKRVSQRINQRVKMAARGIAFNENGDQIQLGSPEEIDQHMQMEMAHLANLRDSINYSSPENRRKLAPVFADKTTITMDMPKRDATGNIEYEIAPVTTLDPSTGAMKFHQNDDGTLQMERKAKMEKRRVTVKELSDEMDQNAGRYAQYHQGRRTWGGDVEEMRRQGGQGAPGRPPTP